MEKVISDFFHIDPTFKDNIIDYIKKQWKFFFGFFCGVIGVLLLN